MGTLFTPIPVTQEVHEWVLKSGTPAPPFASPGRYPTLNDIRAALQSLSGYAVKSSFGTGTWFVEITNSTDPRSNALMIVKDFTGDESDNNVSQGFYFRNGSEEIMVQILKKLSETCGMFALVCDADLKTIVVAPD